MATVQIPQETSGTRLAPTGPPASSTIRLFNLCVQLLKVLVPLFIIHRLRIVPFPQPFLLIQLLLQPLFPTQLLQRQPL